MKYKTKPWNGYPVKYGGIFIVETGIKNLFLSQILTGSASSHNNH